MVSTKESYGTTGRLNINWHDYYSSILLQILYKTSCGKVHYGHNRLHQMKTSHSVFNDKESFSEAQCLMITKKQGYENATENKGAIRKLSLSYVGMPNIKADMYRIITVKFPSDEKCSMNMGY